MTMNSTVLSISTLFASNDDLKLEETGLKLEILNNFTLYCYLKAITQISVHKSYNFN